MTAYSFVEQVRMFHAIDLLKHTKDSILHIAVACGFYDHSAFIKRFKKFPGNTPLQFRRSHQSLDELFQLLAEHCSSRNPFFDGVHALRLQSISISVQTFHRHSLN